MIDYVEYYEDLVGSKFSSPILIYAGEFDARDGPYTQNSWLWNMTYDHKADFDSQSRQIYWVQNETSGEWLNGGLYRQAGLFSFLTVPKAGHFVPNNYYASSFAFFSDYVALAYNSSLAPGLVCKRTDGNGCSTVAAKCEAMNNCWGSLGVCQDDGTCKCREGWKGGDCSLEAMKLHVPFDAYLKSTGPKYYSFYYGGDIYSKASYIKGSTTVPIDIYISIGPESNPN